MRLLFLKFFFNSYFNKSTICINLANRLQVAPRLKQVMVLRELEMELEYSEEDEDSMFAHDQTRVVFGRQENVDSRGSDIVDAVEMETEDNLRPSKRVKTTDVKIWTLTQLATTVENPPFIDIFEQQQQQYQQYQQHHQQYNHHHQQQQ